MSSSLRRHEGYLLIDHRNSPGVPDVLAGGPGLGRGCVESATITCSHCHAIVVLRPDRTRERGYCQRCDHYICDGCTEQQLTAIGCRPFTQYLDQLQADAFRAEHASRGSIIVHP